MNLIYEPLSDNSAFLVQEVIPRHGEKKGRMFVCVESSEAEALSLIKSYLAENFFSSSSPVYESLKLSLDGMLTENSLSESFCVVYAEGQSLFVAVYGNIGFGVLRGESYVPILSGNEQVQLARGSLSGDKYILGNRTNGVQLFLASPEKALTRTRKRLGMSIDSLVQRLNRKRSAVSPERFEGTRKKVWLTPALGILLLVILSVSVVFGVRKQKENRRREAFEPKYNQALHDYEEAKSLAELSPSRAKGLVLSAQTSLNGLVQEGYDYPELTDLQGKIKNDMGTITGIYSVTPDVFLDLTLLRSDMVGTDLAYSTGTMRILDKEGQRVVSVNLSSKETKIVAGEKDLFGGFAVGAYADRSFVLAPDGVREVGENVELLVPSRDWEAKDSLFYIFGGNVYTLERSSDIIWRYPATFTGYNVTQEWLSSGLSVDFSDARDWAIDGAIYILTDTGVDKYLQGAPKHFSFEGFDSAPQFDKIFSYDEAQYVYFLDSEGGRVVKTNKDGAYQAEYQSDSFKGAQDFLVDEGLKLGLVLTGAKVYSFQLAE